MRAPIDTETAYLGASWTLSPDRTMMCSNPGVGALLWTFAVWLRSLGLEEYEAAFRDNKINERVLPNLTAEDLKELGVASLGHRRKLLDAIAALRTDASGKVPSAGVATTSGAPSVSPEDRAERRQVTVVRQLRMTLGHSNGERRQC